MKKHSISSLLTCFSDDYKAFSSFLFAITIEFTNSLVANFLQKEEIQQLAFVKLMRRVEPDSLLNN
jgi:hypothetical protein